MPLYPIRKVIDDVMIKHQRTIARECGHAKKLEKGDFRKYEWSICRDCSPVSDHWVQFITGRNEWICKCGVGHYDPRLVKYPVHGCCGCCHGDDAPWKV